jgi:hypothetical protein
MIKEIAEKLNSDNGNRGLPFFFGVTPGGAGMFLRECKNEGLFEECAINCLQWAKMQLIKERKKIKIYYAEPMGEDLITMRVVPEEQEVEIKHKGEVKKIRTKAVTPKRISESSRETPYATLLASIEALCISLVEAKGPCPNCGGLMMFVDKQWVCDLRCEEVVKK